MVASPQLHVSMPHVEKLADFLVLGLPIFPLTSQALLEQEYMTGGLLARSEVLEQELRRRYGAICDEALGHGLLLEWNRIE